MKLEYTGYRPIISERGISFKKGKDDKFIYLPFAYEIIDALSNNYETNHNHSYDIKIQQANIENLYKKVIEYFPNLDKEIEQKLENYTKHLDEEKIEIEKRISLSDISKNIYLENLKIMKEYRRQRAKNKIFYYYCIYTISEIIKKNRIKGIVLPFNVRFWHILGSVQGELQSQKIFSNLKIDNIEGLKIKFTINLF